MAGARAALLAGGLAALLPAAVPAEAAPVEASGFLRLDHYGRVAEQRYRNERVRLTALSQLRAAADNGSWAALLELIGHVEYGAEGVAAAPAGLTLRSLDALVRRAYFSLRFDAFDLDLGKKFVRWGKVDFFSPLDVINHADVAGALALGDPLEGPLADPLLHLTLYPADDLIVELVYVPFLAPSVVAVDEFDLDVRGGGLEVDVAFRYPEMAPFSEFAHSIHGAISWSTFLADLQVSYSYFRDQLPDIDLRGLQERIGARHVIEGVVQPAYERAHNFGLGASLSLGGWVISTDVGAKFHERNPYGQRIDIRNPEIRSVLQVDRGFAVGAQQFFATGGVIHRLVLYDDSAWQSGYSEFLESFIGDFADRSLLQHDPSIWYLLSRLQTSFLREQLSLEATAAWGLTEAALYLAPRVSYALTDTWSVAAGANLWLTLDGPASTKTGLLRLDDAKDNVFVRTTLRY